MNTTIPFSPSTMDVPPIGDDDFFNFYHCHWHDCDFSFTSMFEFDTHLFFTHLPIQGEGEQIQPIASEFQCHWDECQTKAHTGTDLVNHVKQDHLPVSAKDEHHQCLWVHENGSFRLWRS
jgi:hypothetical protein